MGFDKAVEECKYRAFAAASNQRRTSHPSHARPFADRADLRAQACRATASHPTVRPFLLKPAAFSCRCSASLACVCAVLILPPQMLLYMALLGRERHVEEHLRRQNQHCAHTNERQ